MRYYRDIEGREVDFVLLENNSPFLFLECKSSSRKFQKDLRGLQYLHKKFPKVRALAIAPDYEGHTIDNQGIERQNLIDYLGTLV